MKFENIPASQIVQFGHPRAGTTVIHQALMQLVPDRKIRKVHGRFHTAGPVVLNHRDFRDSIISSIRKKANRDRFNDNEVTKRMLESEIASYDCRLQDLNAMADKYDTDRALYLAYADYVYDHDYLLDSLIKYLKRYDIDATKNRSSALSYISIPNNRKRSGMFKDHKKKDPKSWIHGHHVGSVTPGNWKRVVPDNLHDWFTEQLKPYLTRWGYESD